ncbi:hypothetical protein F443_14761 [Phytophthora nicotianae P1569]|uniref:Uncharacterized protein n=1 Tax=Phytophthora nicotianae P1569 TaxID=1317065 RepID=V9EL48_PHYNI|nr:hypothetical protein F443_14761 [Phytophthora nicotianae P1569]
MSPQRLLCSVDCVQRALPVTGMKHVAALINAYLLPRTLDAAIFRQLNRVRKRFSYLPCADVCIRFAEDTKNMRLMRWLHTKYGLEVWDPDRSMHTAVEMGSCEVVAMLVKKCINRTRNDALHWAVFHQHAEIVQVLVQHALPFEIEEELKNAVYNERWNVVPLLAENASQYTHEALKVAIAVNGSEKIAGLLWEGFRSLVDNADPYFLPATLKQAIWAGSTNLVIMIADKINSQRGDMALIDMDGALDVAIDCGKWDLGKLLIHRCSPLRLESAILFAVEEARWDVVLLILARLRNNAMILGSNSEVVLVEAPETLNEAGLLAVKHGNHRALRVLYHHCCKSAIQKYVKTTPPGLFHTERGPITRLATKSECHPHCMSVALELAAEASEWAAVCRLVRSDRCNRFAVGRALLLAAKAGELDTAANICEAAEPVFADKVVLDLRRAKKLQLGFSATHRRLNDKAVTYNVNTTLIQAAENGEWNLVKKMFMVADRIASVIQATKVAILDILAPIVIGSYQLQLGDECVHVLVRLPQDVEAKMRDELGLTEVRKTRMINQIRHQIKIEQREAEDERREAEKAEEETERIGKIQPSSKRGKDGSTAFSAMEYGQLPKRFRTDEGSVKSGVFYDLMNEPNALTDNMLDNLLKAIENKNCVYQDPTSNEATRIQFMSALFESVVRMFKTDEQ